MNRRLFLQGVSAAAMGAAAGRAEDQAGKAAREYYELRRYHLRNGVEMDLTQTWLRTALVPALGRAGIKPVGVFNVIIGEGQIVHVLIPHPTVESLIALPAKLAGDAQYREAAQPFLSVASSSPAFERVEVALLAAFEKQPRLEAPAQKERIFELRRYESHSETAGKKKIEMFNEAGEIELFKRLGFRPVFFGETLIGGRMPNFEYMVTFDSLDDRAKKWSAFGGDPEWKRMSSLPQYKDAEVVSRITATLLSPAAFSQI